MTNADLDKIKPGDILKLENPGSPSAAILRQRIMSVWTPFPGVRVVRIEYYNVDNPSVLTGGNECELNLNLFGSSTWE